MNSAFVLNFGGCFFNADSVYIKLQPQYIVFIEFILSIYSWYILSSFCISFNISKKGDSSMNKGTVVNLSHLKKAVNYFKNNWCLLLLTSLFLLGITLGVFGGDRENFTTRILNSFSDSFISVRLSGGFKEIFLNSFLLNSAFYLLCFIFGTSVTGVTVVPLCVCVRGLLIGRLVSDLYGMYLLKGIVFNALVIIPSALISVVFLILSARYSLLFSLRVIGAFLTDYTQNNLKLQFNDFWKRQIINFIPIILSCVFDAWISGKVVGMLNL